MNSYEKSVIVQLALGNKSVREEAIAIYRKELDMGTSKDIPEMGFMREVDNVCPDLALRAKYRKQVLQRSYENFNKEK